MKVAPADSFVLLVTLLAAPIALLTPKTRNHASARQSFYLAFENKSSDLRWKSSHRRAEVSTGAQQTLKHHSA
jgi:hypothetical protein